MTLTMVVAHSLTNRCGRGAIFPIKYADNPILVGFCPALTCLTCYYHYTRYTRILLFHITIKHVITC